MNGSAGLAARRMIELESMEIELHELLSETIKQVETCVIDYNTVYAEDIRRELNSCEWTIYRYTSMLDALRNMTNRTEKEFDISGVMVEQSVPRLIGIRHCIHHRGLVGLNIAEFSEEEPVVCFPVGSIRKHGNWSSENEFQKYFHGNEGNVVAVNQVLEDSKEQYSNCISDIKGQLEEEYGKEKLKQKAEEAYMY